MDAAIVGTARVGHCRVGVFTDKWGKLLERVKAGGLSADITRRALSLATRDGWTGWRTKRWSTSTIEMVLVKRGARQLASLAGVYPVLEAVGLTADPVVVGDQILDGQGNYWDVEAVEPLYWLDSFDHRVCHMNHARLYQADFGSTTWTKSRASDARYRTKVWMDTRLRAAQITQDDDSALANYVVIFNEPPYPLELEFRGGSNMDGLYVIDQPNSTPLRDADQIIRDYTDHVPIHVMAVDSAGCTGTALQHKMVAELQYIAETFPESSQRTLERRSKHDRDLGGMWLYDTEYLLSYTRSAAT